jgi:hypothetical protein
MSDPRWQDEFDRLVDVGSAQPTPTPSGGPRRSRSDVVAEMFKAVDEVVAGSIEDIVPVHGEGSAAYGRLVLTVSADAVVSCTADPGWVSQRSPDELTEALATALAAARADLAKAEAATPTGRMQRLIGELGRDE